MAQRPAFPGTSCLVGALALWLYALPAAGNAAEKVNFLLITVDDMNCDSVGAFGCKVPDTTPNIDQLAAAGMRFNYAHVQVGNCMPSRNVMWSGRYPHTTGVEGFFEVAKPKFPVLCDLMKQAGYYTAIRGKVSHSTPYSPYPGWDANLDKLDGVEQKLKDPESYYRSTKRGIQSATDAGKPFCLLINISDPHKPFYHGPKDPFQPTHTITASAAAVPGFLPDKPPVRHELAAYYNSVRRADDCVGQILRALEEAHQSEHTFVLFLSDHGMPLPFAKTQLYHHSTRTPWIVRWPGAVTAGAVDDKHMISAIDALPTLLAVAGIAPPEGLQGSSFLPLLKGEPQVGRDYVIKEYDENAGRDRAPMRAVQTREYLYIYNPWSDGKKVMKTATQGTETYREMVQLALKDAAIRARLDLLDHRVPEELYDVAHDPDCLHNLIHDQSHAAECERLRSLLHDWMRQTGDPLLKLFENRDDQALAKKTIQEQQQIANRRPRNAPDQDEE